MAEKIVRANGIDIWTEDFGNPGDPPLLLIMGASAQGIYWPEHLVQRLVDRGRYVIRYDNRDTGQSTCFDLAADPYTLDDMAADAMFRRLTGSAEPFNEARQRDIATREVDRAANFEAMNNHALAIGMSSPPDRRPQLAELEVATLVVHGTEDPILPYPHGVALAETIPGATLMTLEGAGHEMPDLYLDEMIDAMVEVSERAA